MPGPAKKAAAAAPPPKKENKQKIKDSEDITEQGMTDEQVDEAVEGFLDAEIITGMLGYLRDCLRDCFRNCVTVCQLFHRSVKMSHVWIFSSLFIDTGDLGNR